MFPVRHSRTSQPGKDPNANDRISAALPQMAAISRTMVEEHANVPPFDPREPVSLPRIPTQIAANLPKVNVEEHANVPTLPQPVAPSPQGILANSATEKNFRIMVAEHANVPRSGRFALPSTPPIIIDGRARRPRRAGSISRPLFAQPAHRYGPRYGSPSLLRLR